MSNFRTEEQLQLQKIIYSYQQFKADKIELSEQDYKVMGEIDYAYDVITTHGFTANKRKLLAMICSKFGMHESTANLRLFQAQCIHGAQYKVVKDSMRKFQSDFLHEIQINANKIATVLMVSNPTVAVKAMQLVADTSKTISDLWALTKADEVAIDPESFQPHNYFFSTDATVLKDANGKPISDEKLKAIDTGVANLIKKLNTSTFDNAEILSHEE